ncbi:MAG: hypothetical protein A2V77_08525 [Anaeromyxobacter sp. RBG_16_69_14]|nr:MAG: hypothetical protein A2V77_08525 [Anaeromyxobacter sp. RBG_16_69_14]
MPIYEYLCEGCGLISEVIQKVSDPSPRSCPECGSKKIAKLVSRSAFQLKGGGWYADLYSSKKKGGQGGDAAAAPGSKEASSSDKPASSDKPDKPASSDKPDKPASKDKPAAEAKPAGKKKVEG